MNLELLWSGATGQVLALLVIQHVLGSGSTVLKWGGVSFENMTQLALI